VSIIEFHGGPITHRYLMNRSKADLARMYMQLLDSLETKRQAYDLCRDGAQLAIDERDRLLFALTPSADTKAAYMGEITDDVVQFDFDGYQHVSKHPISWTAIKEIMAIIRKKAGVE